jgi:uncharacterized protein (TIGR04255 family)
VHSRKAGAVVVLPTVGWNLPKMPRETFKRNSLAIVVAQLRFQPILRLTNQHADFQEAIRRRFPGYESVDTQQIEIRPDGVNVVLNERVHRFKALEDPITVALDSSSVSIEYSAHRQHSTLLSDFQDVLRVLEDYTPIPVRLGLRYVNIIEREKVSAQLGKDVAWSDLLSPAFANVPAGLASVDESTNYFAQVTSPCSRGKMTVKYGVLTALGSEGQHFRLDTDRFMEGGFMTNEVLGLLENFSEDIFQVFKKAAGFVLLEWMNSEGAK